MKLRDLIKKSVEAHDVRTVGRIVDELRDRFKLDYHGIANMFNKHAGLDRDQFEGLMQEVDELEAGE